MQRIRSREVDDYTPLDPIDPARMPSRTSALSMSAMTPSTNENAR
jgi:hypothetical protein